jgi:uncharacterized damage-inducible protein DinB
MTDPELFSETKIILFQLLDTINQLNNDEYTQKIELLGNSSIGEHTRHIIELFQQLLTGYETATVDYDNRKRNIEIQQNVNYACQSLSLIINGLELNNKSLLITTVYNQRKNKIESNYMRELMFNIEHCIHHQAIIKIGLLCIGKNVNDKNFGVAKSTIIYKEKCAQ